MSSPPTQRQVLRALTAACSRSGTKGYDSIISRKIIRLAEDETYQVPSDGNEQHDGTQERHLLSALRYRLQSSQQLVTLFSVGRLQEVEGMAETSKTDDIKRELHNPLDAFDIDGRGS